MNSEKVKVLIAGVGGASLGTELLKCLLCTQRYEVFGCDISRFAFGLYQQGLKKTFLVNPVNYIESIKDICVGENIDFIIPGGEQPVKLLANSMDFFDNQGIKLLINDPEVIKTFSNKEQTFKTLNELGFPVPATKVIQDISDLEDFIYPCVIKPSSDSGGSDYVFLAENKNEAIVFAEYLKQNQKIPLVQEYIRLDGGEFSFGLLCFPREKQVLSIAMKREFPSKLSIHMKSPKGLISSPYGQGLIDKFTNERAYAEKIAMAIGGSGPINIQGRFKNGVFLPFEINPRFSGSTYLRALAGFNEPDILIQYYLTGRINVPQNFQYGYYLRSLSETFVSMEKLK